MGRHWFRLESVVIVDMNAGGLIKNIVPQWAEKVRMSDDGSLLAVWEGGDRGQYLPSWFKIRVVSLPSGTETYVFPESSDFTLANNGSRIAYTERVTNRRFVMDLGGLTTYFSDNIDVLSEPVLSPNGEMVAVPSRTPSSITTTYLYHLDSQGGAAQLVNAVPGVPVRWLDDNRLFTYTMKDVWEPVSQTVYDKTIIYDAQGNVVANPPSVYDVLHRRTELRVRTGAAAEVLAEQTIYGETQANPQTANLRGKVYQVNDGAGVVTNVSYDFKGNLLVSQRRLAQTYTTQLDWSATVPLEPETFSQTTAYDAMNRPTSITTPDASEIKPTYNEAGLLEKVEARIRNAANWTTFVDDIDYDAKGQRERIAYGNGVITEYEYDEFTFRVKRIKTTRVSDNKILQDLRYTYDAVGNIVEMADLAYATFFHGGQEIKPVWQYEYDALYRLTNATGREHAGQQSNTQQDENGFPLVTTPNPNDPQAMRMYAESYHYDAVGNLLKMVHDAQSNTGDWTRHYHIAATSNRLLDTSLPGDNELDAEYSAVYLHDTHGNMTKMPHLDGIDWDFKDQMRHVDKGGGGHVYFTYDASGQRIRKAWVRQNIVEERIYLGGYEVYRRRQNNSLRLERQTLHIMDDTRRIAMVETKTIDTSGPPFTPTPRFRYQCSNHLDYLAQEKVDDDGWQEQSKMRRSCQSLVFPKGASICHILALRALIRVPSDDDA